MVLSWYSWNCPFTKRRTRLDLPTADSPNSTNLNWQILPWLAPFGLCTLAPLAAIPHHYKTHHLLLLNISYILSANTISMSRWQVTPQVIRNHHNGNGLNKKSNIEADQHHIDLITGNLWFNDLLKSSTWTVQIIDLTWMVAVLEIWAIVLDN